jgi:hypothetical protein
MGEKHYEKPIFANHFYPFQMDIIDQSKLSKDSVPVQFIDSESDSIEGKKIFPPFIYVFQNVNTKYVKAVAMPAKDTKSVLSALEILWDVTDGKVISLVSDEESALKSNTVTALLHAHKIST